MMKVFYSIILLILINAIPLLGIYFIFDDMWRLVVSIVWCVVYLCLFIFADKFLLLYLGAREIIDSDEKNFFQVLKSEVFKMYEVGPRVYVYSGQGRKCFILYSRDHWSLVIDRSLLADFGSLQHKALVRFAIEFKQSSACWLQTKGMGLIAVIIGSATTILSTVGINNGKNRFKNMLTVLVLILMWPVVEIIYWITKSRSRIAVATELQPIFYQAQNTTSKSFLGVLVYKIVENISVKNFICYTIELFPFLDNCVFVDKAIE